MRNESDRSIDSTRGASSRVRAGHSSPNFAHLRAVIPVLAVLAVLPVSGWSQEFSAKAVAAPIAAGLPATGADSALPYGKMFVRKDKMRLESGGVNAQTLIVDDENRLTTVIFPTRKTYETLQARPTVYFRVTDPQNACPDWQRAAGSEIACEKVGEVEAGGRKTIKYSSPLPHGTGGSIWVDPKLRYVVKWSDSDSIGELREIVEGTQPVDMFAVPPGYEEAKGAHARPSRAMLRRK